MQGRDPGWDPPRSGAEALSTRPLQTLTSEAFPSSETQPRPQGKLAHIPLRADHGAPRLT